MAANKKFTPRASSNLIEDEVTEDKKDTVVDTSTEDTTAEDVAPKADVEEKTEAKTDEAKTDEDKVDEDKAEDSTPETSTEGNKTDEVTFTAKTDKKPIERMVKIRLAKKYDGCIGGVWYHFAKDQVVNVPENVKRILNSIEGMLKPL